MMDSLTNSFKDPSSHHELTCLTICRCTSQGAEILSKSILPRLSLIVGVNVDGGGWVPTLKGEQGEV